jgi:hypothetical protein
LPAVLLTNLPQSLFPSPDGHATSLRRFPVCTVRCCTLCMSWQTTYIVSVVSSRHARLPVIGGQNGGFLDDGCTGTRHPRELVIPRDKIRAVSGACLGSRRHPEDGERDEMRVSTSVYASDGTSPTPAMLVIASSPPVRELPNLQKVCSGGALRSNLSRHTLRHKVRGGHGPEVSVMSELQPPAGCIMVTKKRAFAG